MKHLKSYKFICATHYSAKIREIHHFAGRRRGVKFFFTRLATLKIPIKRHAFSLPNPIPPVNLPFPFDHLRPKIPNK